ncbi:unnamed protein product [Candida verbasci]|uniref:Alpha-1,3/1,6-mannosyltransferase ALG2 n=1 Tax=Candida verbasci TaxID=1227364 RepID=A0A9W4U2Y9_9ASCO|nr:unnamed protein product [Candida verbasci]
MARIAFIHPDLGIGGAERLVVDAAIGLQNQGNQITIYTSHCDLSHCFDEISSGQLKVKVFGDFLPTNILKKFHILCAIIRQLYLVIKLIITGEISQFDFFIVDQLSFCIPLLQLFNSYHSRVLFYCHFPDQLLTKRNSTIKSIYRIPFDYIEEYSTGCADKIVVNSNFTKSIFHETFKLKIDPGVVYPCVDLKKQENTEDISEFFKNSKFYLSINRFERSKNIELAIKAFAKARKLITGPKARLVIAGGFDSRVIENVEYLSELTSLCDELKLTNFTIRGKLIVMPPSTDVLFLPSISNSLKISLIKNCELLLYTPTREHFGIVPLEATLYNKVVVGINHGGPLETIVNYDGENIDEATGFLASNDSEIWSKIILKYSNEIKLEVKEQLGKNCHNRVVDNFSRDAMTKRLIDNLEEASIKSKTKVSLNILFITVAFLAFALYKFI